MSAHFTPVWPVTWQSSMTHAEPVLRTAGKLQGGTVGDDAASSLSNPSASHTASLEQGRGNGESCQQQAEQADMAPGTSSRPQLQAVGDVRSPAAIGAPPILSSACLFTLYRLPRQCLKFLKCACLTLLYSMHQAQFVHVADEIIPLGFSLNARSCRLGTCAGCILAFCPSSIKLPGTVSIFWPFEDRCAGQSPIARPVNRPLSTCLCSPLPACR